MVLNGSPLGKEKSRMRSRKRLALFILFTALFAVFSFVSVSFASSFDKIQLTGEVRIKGDLKVGNVLTADLSGVFPAEATFETSWIVDGTVRVSKAASFRLTQADQGKSVSVRIDGTGEYEGKLVSDPEKIGIEHGADDPVFSVGDVIAFSGEKIAVPIYASIEKEIAVLVLTPVVPPGFVIERVENGNVFSSCNYEKNIVLDGGNKDGLAVTLFITPPQNVSAGVYPLVLNVWDCVNMMEKTVVVKTENGSLTFTSPGDANGDGSVTALDLIRLKKYLASTDATSGSSDMTVGVGADADGDGAVDAQDLARLKRYFAEFDVISGSSPVLLGKEN